MAAFRAELTEEDHEIATASKAHSMKFDDLAHHFDVRGAIRAGGIGTTVDGKSKHGSTPVSGNLGPADRSVN